MKHADCAKIYLRSVDHGGAGFYSLRALAAACLTDCQLVEIGIRLLPVCSDILHALWRRLTTEHGRHRFGWQGVLQVQDWHEGGRIKETLALFIIMFNVYLVFFKAMILQTLPSLVVVNGVILINTKYIIIDRVVLFRRSLLHLTLAPTLYLCCHLAVGD